MAEEHISNCRTSRRTRGGRILPHELEDEILVRLPIKSLLRFESVCKSWLFRLHSRSFINLHNSTRHLHTKLRPISPKKLKRMIPGLADPCITKEEGKWTLMLRIFGPLNGVYCITSYPFDSTSQMYSFLLSKIALLNPATREHRLASPFPCELHSLLSDISSKRCHIYTGFGRALKDNDDHRIVVLINYNRARREKRTSAFLALVYSLQKGVWKKLADCDPGKRSIGEEKATDAFSGLIRIFPCLEDCPQRFFEGCYHWIATAKDGWFVLSFSFAEESFKLIGMPPPHGEVEQSRAKQGELFVLHDHLVAVYFFTVFSGEDTLVAEVAVWMMMDYGVEESCTKIHSIKPGFICGALGMAVFKLHGIHYTPLKSGGIRIKRLLFRNGSERHIISCDGAGHQSTKRTYSNKLIPWNTVGISTYAETLERLYKRF